jgi:hypothetical protein
VRITDYGGTNQDENAGSNNRADPKRSEIPRRQCFLEAMLRLIGIGQDLIDGFRPEKSAAHSLSQAQRAKVRFMMGATR